ncbi:DRTGG domain-containing protein [Deltaproteobacteria bacterium]|nr:DRTGG domain-containing protein [Deltaproteobacteria bacterium]
MMKLSEVKEILDAEIIIGDDKMDIELAGGAASDLMSDLLRNPKEGALLLTGLTSIQAIRTTVIAGMTAIVFVRGKRPDPEIISYAREQDIAILSSPYNMYSSCGRLYSKGLRSIRWNI